VFWNNVTKQLSSLAQLNEVLPALRQNKKVVLDFTGVTSTTQSFVHALISKLIQEFGPAVLDRLIFKSCNQTVKKLVSIVIDYMQYEETTDT
jgi:hypothetical protein